MVAIDIKTIFSQQPHRNVGSSTLMHIPLAFIPQLFSSTIIIVANLYITDGRTA